MRDVNGFQRSIFAVAAALLVLVMGHQLQTARDRFIDPDELEHLNAASFIAEGETLYVSFFENHPPLTYALLQPVVRSTEDAADRILRGRGLSLFFSAGILLTVAGLAHAAAGPAAGGLAALLLATHIFYFYKTMEVRPDVPATLCLMLGLAGMITAIRRRRIGWLVAGGALLAVGGLFTPKLIYGAAGGCFGACVAWHRRGKGEVATAGLRAGTAILVGAAGVSALAAAEMARQGILAGFVEDCIRVSLNMTVPNPAGYRRELLPESFLHNAGLWFLGVPGFFALLRIGRFREAGGAEVLGLSAAFSFVGLFLIDAPLRQYYLTFLPAIAVAAGSAGVLLLDTVRARAGLAVGGLALVALLAASLAPAARVIARETPSWDAQLATLDRVLSVSEPGDRVLDTWTGLYLGRLPALRHFYINHALLSVVERGDLEAEMLEGLADPQVKVVLYGQLERAVPEAVRRVVRRDFERLPGTGIRVRRVRDAPPILPRP